MNLISMLFKYGVALTVSASPVPTCAPALREADTKVYYFYLFANTTTPLDIESAYDLTSLVRNKVPQIVKALAVEDLPSTGFKSSMTRLKLVPPRGKPIAMDLMGNVSGLGKPHRLSVESQKGIRKLLYSAFPDDVNDG